jgi:hypothetical protein
MSKDFRTAAFAASITIGTSNILVVPAAHAAVGVDGAKDAVSTAVETQLVSSENPNNASEILLAALSGMDPQQKMKLAIDRIPAPNVRRVYEIEAAAGCKTLSCVCTNCCITLADKGQAPTRAAPPKAQSPSNPSPPKMERSPGAKH